MKYSVSRLLLFMLVILFMGGCSSKSNSVIKDLSKESYQLLTQDSTQVTFPGDFEGKPILTSYIYTHCQSVCPAITANMKNISEKLPESSSVQFVMISFDPTRDTPSALRQYMKKFKLNPDRFTFLTGDSTTVYSLMDEIGMRIKVKRNSSPGRNGYMFNHSNRINLIDRKGRIVGDYGGSMTPPKIIIEDLHNL